MTVWAGARGETACCDDLSGAVAANHAILGDSDPETLKAIKFPQESLPLAG